MTHEEFLSKAAEIAPSYQASQNVRQHLSQVDLVPIIGPSGVGKSTIIEALGLPIVLSDMSRERRQDENDGVDAFFRSDYDRMLEELLTAEFAQVAIGPDGEFYATRSSAYPPKGLAAMPLVASVLDAIRAIGFNNVTPICLVAPSPDEWARRYATKQHSPERNVKRLLEAKGSLARCLADPQIHFVLNDHIDTAVADIRGILDGRMPPHHRDKQARAAAEAMLAQLQ